METERGTNRLLVRGLSTAATVLAVAIVAGCDDSAGKAGGSSGGDPASAEKVLKQADEYMLDGKTQQAITAYGRAIEADPSCEKAYIGRAMLYNESGEAKKAFADYSKAIELGTRSSYAYEERAKIYRAYGKEDKARLDDECALAIRNKQWDDLKNLRKKK